MGRATAPLLPFCVTVGVTGHRREALLESLAHLRSEAESVLRLVSGVASATQSSEPVWYSQQPADLRLLSPLADGADQILAYAAMEAGFAIDAVLPFAKDAYRELLHDSSDRTAFDELIDAADRVLELPGERTAEPAAYVMAGRATVAHSDLLVAVWDGQRARGHGGTADVVELALRRGTPVVHIDSTRQTPTRLLWSGFDPAVVTEKPGTTVHRPFDEKHLTLLFSRLFQPPLDAHERRFARTFYAERQRRFRTRVEYPLLLTVAGVAAFDPRSVREAHCAAAVRREWDGFVENCAGSGDLEPALEVLRDSFVRSDHLASRFAQTYRSGHIFNFLLGGIAVCIGLTANLLPQYLLQFAIAEAAVTAAILLNTKLGVRNEWHRRWLDYRQLAERLRPMRSLKLLALAAPGLPGTRANPTPRRWMEWYALAVWRAIGCPNGRLDPRLSADRAKAVAAHEIGPQISYHEKHARQIELLDRRLERISAGLFLATLLASLFVVGGAAFDPAIVNDYNSWLTLVGAGFPALGTAVFGIRFQADFGGSAVRSQNTANALKDIESELNDGPQLDRAADLAEQASMTMLADLDEWRMVNQQQELDLL